MSKVQKKTAKKKAFRMTVAERMRKYGVPEGGTTLVIEHGTAALPGNADKGVPAQVYLRWVGKRDGEPFASAMRGPWGVTVCGTVIEVEELDRVELVRDRNDLEERSRVEGLTLQMAEVQSGSTLGDWRPVLPAVAWRAPEGSATSGQAVDGKRKVPAWRDPAVEMPDDDITVICRFESEDYPVYPASHDEHGWGDGCGSVGTYTDKVTGWMHLHEAAMILDGAWKWKAVPHD